MGAMNENGKVHSREDQIVFEAISSHLEHFKNIDPPCRGLALPDRILHRNTLATSLHFYLRTGVDNGKIKTHVFATDSPYGHQKFSIDTVVTPIFEPRADHINTPMRRGSPPLYSSRPA